MGLVVVAGGLRCPEACGILVPRPGVKPESPASEGRFLMTGPLEKSFFKNFIGGIADLQCWVSFYCAAK